MVLEDVPDTSNPPFALHPGIDAGVLAEAFAAKGRVRIHPFLDPDSAARLRDHLEAREDWLLSLRGEGEKVFEFPSAARAALSPEQGRALEKLAAPGAEGFRYLYERIWAVDDRQVREEGTLLAGFATFLHSAPVLDLLRRITGLGELAIADAQATRYAPGHFLTIHSDREEGRQRRVAYVLGLTGEWRPEWGGLLMFHDAEQEVEEAWQPRFNALTLFAVPRSHSVSAVAPFAPRPRYAVSGWLMPERTES